MSHEKGNGNDKNADRAGTPIKAHFICSSFELLADKSRDLSQVEKKITVVKAKKIHKMTIIFTQNGQKLLFL